MTDQKDIKTLQATGQGPVPCARFCEATAFNIEIAGWKRDQAENLANQCKLVDQITALTIEREALESKVDRLEWENKGIAEWQHEWSLMKANRDKAIEVVVTLTAERDECRRQSDLQMNSAIKFCQERNAARIERDALKADIRQMSADLAAIEKMRQEKDARMYAEKSALKDAARLALDALERILYKDGGEPAFFKVREAIAVLKAAL